MPTLFAACGVALPEKRIIDGANLLSVLKGETVPTPERTIYLQWHRGGVPELNHACMARGPRYKIAQPLGVAEGMALKDPKFELYDILADPYEQKNIAAEKPEIAAALRKGYEAWFADVKQERNFQPPRIHLGAPKENPGVLTRQDHRGPATSGGWEVHVERPGKCRVTLLADAALRDRTAHIKLGDETQDVKLPKDARSATIEAVTWMKGDGKLEAWVEQGSGRVSAKYVEVERVGELKAKMTLGRAHKRPTSPAPAGWKFVRPGCPGKRSGTRRPASEWSATPAAIRPGPAWTGWPGAGPAGGPGSRRAGRSAGQSSSPCDSRRTPA
jgi:hypothetical protein